MHKPLVIVVTGGGSMVLPRILARPGTSRFVLEARVPYHSRALQEFLGRGSIEKAASESTARRMAVAAFERAAELVDAAEHDPWEVAGVACTAALATNRERRGRDAAFLALHTIEQTITESIDLGRGRSDRRTQEAILAERLAMLVAEIGVPVDPAAGLEASEIADPLVVMESAPRRQVHRASSSWRSLMRGEIVAVDAGAGVPVRGPIIREQAVVFPGSFNPMHEGHRQMARVARERLGREVLFELSVTNADKPSLDYLSIAERVEPFRHARLPLVLTRSPRFDSKAERFPGSVFLVGADTAVRIADPRFYGDSLEERDAALDRIAALGCRFLVFGRQVEGMFRAAELLDLPPAMQRISDPVPESKFRKDISSTELRGDG